MDLLFMFATLFAVANLPIQGWKKWLSLIVVLSLWVPVFDSHLLGVLYGLISSVSVVSVLLLLHYTMHRHLDVALLPKHALLYLAWGALMVGVLLILDVSNLWHYSLYGLGYEALFSGVLILFIVFAVLAKQLQLLLVVFLIWLSWLAGVGASDNGWDYGFDFMFFLWAMIHLLRRKMVQKGEVTDD